MERLPAAAIAKLEELIVTDDGDDPDGGSVGGKRAFLQELKEDPGPLTLETLLAEITKLERVKAIGPIRRGFPGPDVLKITGPRVTWAGHGRSHGSGPYSGTSTS